MFCIRGNFNLYAMKIFIKILMVITVFYWNNAIAQPNDWDVLTTEALISHNKQNYSDHEAARNNQVVSQATVSLWKSTTNKFNQLTNSIDKRLTSLYIITADAGLVYNIYTTLSDMASLEEKSIQISANYPFTVPTMITGEEKIFQTATALTEYITLLVVNYGTISKMKVSDRNLIYQEVNDDLNIMSSECNSLYLFMQRVQLSDELKNTQPYQIINKDKQLVNDILNNLKK